MLGGMAGLLIFIGLGIIVSTILRAQARRRRDQDHAERIRRLHDKLTEGEEWNDESS